MSTSAWTHLTLALFAQASTTPAAGLPMTSREWDWPDSPAAGFALVIGALVVAGWVCWLYRRDAREIGWGWGTFLAALRLTVLGGLLVIALNPQDRTQRTSFRPSRVVVLVDTSLSMRHPASAGSGTETVGPSRTEAVRDLLSKTDLVTRLRKDHEVSLMTFSSGLSGPVQVFPVLPSESSSPGESAAPATTESSAPPAWEEALEPTGGETRLGEALNEAIRQSAGRTLSGIVVVTDGGQNAGIDVATAHDRALATKTRLVTIGVGSTERPINVQMADVQLPTDVQLGDSFDLRAFVQAQGLEGKAATVEVLAAPEGQTVAPEALATQEAILGPDGLAAELTFSIKPPAAGAWKYTVKVTPHDATREFNPLDNEQQLTVRVFDQPTRVLLFAGGPMRDYQFVRNLLFRHKSVDVDVLLQTAAVGTSQESDHLLSKFPSSREEMYSYDIVIAFDPDWRQVPGESIQLLSDWVFQEGGGLILVAGDVNTVQLASAAGQATTMQEQLAPLKELYPVVLTSYLSEMRFDQVSSQPWPVQLTPDGQRAEFVQLTDDPVTSLARWKEFSGIYRCYPTSGAKAGATVLALFSDPRTQNEHGQPILMAEQFFGQGRSLYLGSAEIWRLRAVSEDDYDRFWIKALREVGQGRSKRGTRRGVLLPESRRLMIGQTARLRARVLDAQFQPYTGDTLSLNVIDPAGKIVVPAPRLRPDPGRPGEFVGELRLPLTGNYRLELEIPDSSEVITEELTASLPRLEDEDIRQNAALLNDLARETGGTYLPIDKASVELPQWLPARGEPLTIDERLQTLWDRAWVMYLLVGLLSVEWLTRKLLKLA